MCITISIVGNKHGVYIDSRNCNAYLDITRAENYDCIDFTGVNHVVVYRYDDGKFYISSTGGYTEERGLFCDLYEEGKIL